MYERGKLTAQRNTDVAMTILRVENDRVQPAVVCQWFDRNNQLRQRMFLQSELIGAGDELVFTGGVFVRAQNAL